MFFHHFLGKAHINASLPLTWAESRNYIPKIQTSKADKQFIYNSYVFPQSINMSLFHWLYHTLVGTVILEFKGFNFFFSAFNQSFKPFRL